MGGRVEIENSLTRSQVKQQLSESERSQQTTVVIGQ